jgi:two-component system cell cycle response regulator CtrA
MRVLIIEDDQATSKTIQIALKSEGFVCDCAEVGEDGLEIARHYEYDLILLDLVLPDIDGYEILRRLRAVQVSTPVLILSGLSGIDDKIKGLGVGADDYLTKPFNKDELIARVRAIIRRSKGHPNSVIKVGRLTIDLNTKIVEANGKTLKLTGREHAILELLAIRKGATLSKEIFLNHLYGGMEEPEFKIIDVFVCKLRKKLADALDNQNYIETIWGRGYVLREPPQEKTANKGTLAATENHVEPEKKKTISPSKNSTFKFQENHPKKLAREGG